ncbi:MAG: hypothetical protein DRH17_13585 [Deltaproteobacteria bacterium]|nr:MAG: hypothetical protein DRH17_13585 [Deltaproteobacteria bacterium]
MIETLGSLSLRGPGGRFPPALTSRIMASVHGYALARAQACALAIAAEGPKIGSPEQIMRLSSPTVL